MARGRWLLQMLLLVFALALGYTILSLPGHAVGLQQMVADNMDVSGVSNPVTAVLLNFRGYDTLLEMVVLLLALVGVWSVGGLPARAEVAAGPVLHTLACLLVPVLILVAAYLLWIGAIAPGGAFQAGSVLGAAGVLLFLAGWQMPSRLPLRLALVAGLGVFVAIALLPLFNNGKLLEYPLAQAGVLILIIETAATASIGVTLAMLFLGAQPDKQDTQ